MTMLIDYIFYKFYRYFYRAQGQNDAAMIAMILLSCHLGLNILTILTILEAFHFLPIINLNMIHLSILGLFLFLLCYLYFLMKKRYLEIDIRFYKEEKVKKNKGTFFVWLYLIMSYALFIKASMLRYDIIH
jgi:hypothetical protein